MSVNSSPRNEQVEANQGRNQYFILYNLELKKKLIVEVTWEYDEVFRLLTDQFILEAVTSTEEEAVFIVNELAERFGFKGRWQL